MGSYKVYTVPSIKGAVVTTPETGVGNLYLVPDSKYGCLTIWRILTRSILYHLDNRPPLQHKWDSGRTAVLFPWLHPSVLILAMPINNYARFIAPNPSEEV